MHPMIHSTQTSRRRRAGFTLIELLVVIGILTLLTAVALPNVRDMIRQQKVLRSADVVVSFINGARAKAIGEGRPYGIVIDRAGITSEVGRSQATQLRYAYTPQSYSGDVAGARAQVLQGPPGATIPANMSKGNLIFNPAESAILVAAVKQLLQQEVLMQQGTPNRIQPLIMPGDQIGIGLLQFPLKIQDLRWANPAELAEVGQPASALWPVIELSGADRERIVSFYPTASAIPYHIDRHPTVSIIPPMELPGDTAIDLLYSGLGHNGDEFSPLAIEGNYDDHSNNPFLPAPRDYGVISIMFDSQGSVSVINSAQSSGGVIDVDIRYAPANIYLLLGRAGNTSPRDPLLSDKDDVATIRDPESTWIIINRQTGEVTSAPVDAVYVDEVTGAILDASGAVKAAGTARLVTRVRAAIEVARASAVSYGL